MICLGKLKKRKIKISEEGKPRILSIISFVCITNYPNSQCLKTTSIHYFIVSEGHESVSRLSGWLWHRVSSEAVVKLLAGAALSGGWTGAEESTCKRILSQGCWQGVWVSLQLCLIDLYECLRFFKALLIVSIVKQS